MNHYHQKQQPIRWVGEWVSLAHPFLDKRSKQAKTLKCWLTVWIWAWRASYSLAPINLDASYCLADSIITTVLLTIVVEWLNPMSFVHRWFWFNLTLNSTLHRWYVCKCVYSFQLAFVSDLEWCCLMSGCLWDPRVTKKWQHMWIEVVEGNLTFSTRTITPLCILISVCSFVYFIEAWIFLIEYQSTPFRFYFWRALDCLQQHSQNALLSSSFSQ
jgi:hypothetical protein